MGRFTVEETNLICIYIADTRTELIDEMAGALPFMDEEMRALADHTIDKLRAMSDAEFSAQPFALLKMIDYDEISQQHHRIRQLANTLTTQNPLCSICFLF